LKAGLDAVLKDVGEFSTAAIFQTQNSSTAISTTADVYASQGRDFSSVVFGYTEAISSFQRVHHAQPSLSSINRSAASARCAAKPKATASASTLA
jgi:hypothetical protein